MSSLSPAPAAASAITWDEEVIAEHDKLRGTRMKIDEPDTPFAYGTGEDGEEEVEENESDGPPSGELREQTGASPMTKPTTGD